MEKQKQVEFQEELSALLKKYDLVMGVQDVPASKKVVFMPKKKEGEVTGTPLNTETEVAQA
jgi:hypothetical protein